MRKFKKLALITFCSAMVLMNIGNLYHYENYDNSENVEITPFEHREDPKKAD